MCVCTQQKKRMLLIDCRRTLLSHFPWLKHISAAHRRCPRPLSPLEKPPPAGSNNKKKVILKIIRLWRSKAFFFTEMPWRMMLRGMKGREGRGGGDGWIACKWAALSLPCYCCCCCCSASAALKYSTKNAWATHTHSHAPYMESAYLYEGREGKGREEEDKYTVNNLVLSNNFNICKSLIKKYFIFKHFIYPI